jgi:hypothetical protein
MTGIRILEGSRAGVDQGVGLVRPSKRPRPMCLKTYSDVRFICKTKRLIYHHEPVKDQWLESSMCKHLVISSEYSGTNCYRSVIVYIIFYGRWRSFLTPFVSYRRKVSNPRWVLVCRDFCTVPSLNTNSGMSAPGSQFILQRFQCGVRQ